MALPLSSASISFRVDDSDRVLFINQLSEPFPLPETDTDESPSHLAELYLNDAMSDFDFDSDILAELNSEPSIDLNKDEVQLRIVEVKSHTTFNIVFYAQTYFGIPIWEKGVSININADPIEVVRFISTFTYEYVSIEAPATEVLDNYSNITNAQLASLLETELEDDIVINDSSKIFIYQYLENDRLNFEEDSITWYDSENLPDVDSSINEGEFCFVREILFSFPSGNPVVNWRCLVELNTGSILFLEAMVYGAQAHVLESDPIALGTNPNLLNPAPINVMNVDPNNSTTSLNQFRTLNITLSNLNAPDPTLGQLLRGTYVKILDAIIDQGHPALSAQPLTTPTSRPFTGEPPHELSPYQFYYDAHTDAFAAVCAYYNFDKFFSMLVGMGFTFGSNSDFPNTPMPFPVDYWANDAQGPPFYQSGLGAAAFGNSTNTACLGITLARMVSSNPQQPNNNPNVQYLGVGISYRMILHELAHALLLDRIHSGNFKFSHSFGDSLAALLNDPSTLCPDVFPHAHFDRYTTFPFDGSGTGINLQGVLSRRHGRLISGTTNGLEAIDSGGWYWGGFYDPMGTGGANLLYRAEQILSSTMFDLYKSLGGNSPYLNRRVFASEMVVLLIIKTVKNYNAPSQLLPNAPQLPMDFSEDLIANDINQNPQTTPTSLSYQSTNIPLGASHKVVRWAFEKRGAYYFVPPSQYPAPYTNFNPPPFPPPLVDLYIDDGRSGDYPFLYNFWSTSDIINRHQQDGTTNFVHQNPAPNATNYVYVRIKSRGQTWPTGFVVKAYRCLPSAGNVWPQDWTALTTPSIFVTTPTPSPTHIIVGPFAWTAPSLYAHVCFLVAVSSAVSGTPWQITNDDKANTEAIQTSIPEWHLVPNDNNIAQRNVVLVPGSGGSSSLPGPKAKYTFFVRNPYDTGITVTIEVTLPSLLEEKGWGITFGDSGNEIDLDSFDRDGVLVTFDFEAGEEFTQQELENSDDRDIIFVMVAPDGAIGGMTYRLDPNLEEDE